MTSPRPNEPQTSTKANVAGFTSSVSFIVTWLALQWLSVKWPVTVEDPALVEAVAMTIDVSVSAAVSGLFTRFLTWAVPNRPL